ncbi:MAG TPA: hypothetical protein VIL35_13475 [Vicinamibacterales bacterium]
MPILVRPVREQLEHDRIIRLLQAKWRPRFRVEANPGDERNAPVKVGSSTFYPDLVLTEEGGRRPRALVEVETGESVNHLEALAQWAHLAKSRSALYLFVPVGSAETARRLATDHQIEVAQLWTYMVIGDQVRFTSIFREPGPDPLDLLDKPVSVSTATAGPPAPAPAPGPEAPQKTEPPRAAATNGRVAPRKKPAAAAAPAKTKKAAPRPSTSKASGRAASRAAASRRSTSRTTARPAASSRSTAKRAATVKRAAASSRTTSRTSTKRAPAAAKRTTAKRGRTQKRR